MQPTHPFKIFRYCPKCGKSGLIIDSARSLRCTGCGFNFFINSAAAVAALIANNKGELLLTFRGIEPGYGMLDLPGGFIDPGETAENAVRRELQEELELNVRSLKYICSAPNEYIYNGLSVFTVDMAFEVIPETIDGITPMDDISGFKFYAEEDIDYGKIHSSSMSYFIKQFFSK
jgi:NAD+ diphosphatase